VGRAQTPPVEQRARAHPNGLVGCATKTWTNASPGHTIACLRLSAKTMLEASLACARLAMIPLSKRTVRHLASLPAPLAGLDTLGIAAIASTSTNVKPLPVAQTLHATIPWDHSLAIALRVGVVTG